MYLDKKDTRLAHELTESMAVVSDGMSEASLLSFSVATLMTSDKLILPWQELE